MRKIDSHHSGLTHLTGEYTKNENLMITSGGEEGGGGGGVREGYRPFPPPKM